MVDRLNPAEQTAAESDYEKKFNKKSSPSETTKKIKDQEATGGDASWKTSANKKRSETADKNKGRFSFTGKRGGKLRRGSAFIFIAGLILGGVWYTSVLAPNILLVNIKEMYTNDLADATTALEIYTQIMYFNKIGPLSGQDCISGQPMSSQPIKCKLTTFSRSQKEAFERQGFTFGTGEINIGPIKTDAGNVGAQKVYEDNRDDGDAKNDLAESRYKIYAIIPPNYKQVVDSLKANGTSTLLKTIQGEDSNVSSGASNAIKQLLNPLKDASQSPEKMLDAILKQAPITSGPQLWLYSQLSSTTRAQVYGVFNPRSSFFTDAQFKERIKSRYNMTKNVTVTGNTEQKVNRAFDNAVQKSDGGIDQLTGQVNATDGVSLASLSSPLNLTQLKSLAGQLTNGVNQDTVKNVSNNLPVVGDLQIAGNLLATKTFSYTDLMCSWYTIGKMSSNALIRAKASTAARYALQYLKAADAIKAGSAEEVPTNVLASKLAQTATGGYNGASATDSMLYRSITYGDLVPDDPKQLGKYAADAAAIVAYNLSAYENIGTLAASWAQVIPNAVALGAVIGASGTLAPPPANLNGADRQYCLSGETTTNKTTTKGENTQTTRCLEAITAMVPPGMQAVLGGAAEVGRRTCPPVNAYDDNLIQLYIGNWRGPVSNTMLPSQKIVQTAMTPYIAGWFGTNTMLVAAATQQLYTSQIKGIAANYALFSGMGELLGDMAMSRGLMPSNAADMAAYLMLGEVIGGQKATDDIARDNARQHPFDPYNKFSFLGSLVRGLTPSVNSQTPLFATLGNVFSLVGDSTKKLSNGSTANAFYQIQPSLLTGNNAAERMSAYLLRLSAAYCPLDVEYLAIGITPDIMCNVRYSMPLDDIGVALNLSGVVDYMTGTHSDVYNPKIKELNERIAKADPEGNKPYLEAQLNDSKIGATAVSNKPFIDKNTGKPTPGGEYEKYLQYCVNRLDPWGRSAVASRYDGLSDKDKADRNTLQTPDGNPTGTDYKGSPYQKYADTNPVNITMAVTGTQSDQDWYSGKKCTRMTDQPQMLQYFRAYTMMCSVDGSMSGVVDCTEKDHSEGSYSDPFYLNNDILYTSWF